MLYEPFLLAQSIKVTNWLTPVWIMSVGVSLGYLLVVLMLLKISVFQRIGGFNSVTENPLVRVIAGLLTAAFYLALFVGFIYWSNSLQMPTIDALALPLAFGIPISLLLGFGVWSVASRRMAGEIKELVFDGFLSWVNKVCWVMLVFALLGFLLAPMNGFGIVKFVDDPMGMVDSLMRLPFTGKFSKEFTVPRSDDNHIGDRIEIAIDGSELRVMQFDSNQRLEVSPMEITPETPPARMMTLETAVGEPANYVQRSDGTGLFPAEPIEAIYVNNLGDSPAQVNLTWQTSPTYREVAVIPVIAALVVCVYIFYLIFVALAPKVAAISFSTFKTEVSQPLFLIVLGLGVFFIVGTIFVPYNTFGEDIKMYKDSGLTLIRVLAIFLAIWAASKSVAEEIEGRTALTVLSKPVGRRQFVLGKFSGISLAIGVIFIILGLWFFVWVSYKPVYDFQESSKGVAEWSECFVEAIHVIPGLFLCFLEVLIFVAISVAVSTRLGILSNFLICFSIYVLGHLTPLLVQSSLGAFETVAVFGQLVAIVFPVLNHFDVQAAINTNQQVPLEYLAWSVIYTGLYGTMAMLLALVLFEDRDLA
jgi:ABC-type transport system involved in multi-copper enzyme maturation permease subunit